MGRLLRADMEATESHITNCSNQRYAEEFSNEQYSMSAEKRKLSL